MGDFVAHLKGSAPLRWLVIWGAVILALVVTIHFFSRKAPGNQTLAQKMGSDTGNDQDGGGNVTVLINGYPPAAGQVSGTGTTPAPTPIPRRPPTPITHGPPIIAPGPGGVRPPAMRPPAPSAAHAAQAQVATRRAPAPTPAPIVHAAVKSERVAKPAVEHPVVIHPKKASAAQLTQSLRDVAARLRS